MTEIEATQEMTRSEVATYLREFAAELDSASPNPETDAGAHTDRDPHDRRVTFMVGNDSATINPPEQVSFEVEIESDSSILGSDHDHEVTFQMAWQAPETDGDEHDPELEIK